MGMGPILADGYASGGVGQPMRREFVRNAMGAGPAAARCRLCSGVVVDADGTGSTNGYAGAMLAWLSKLLQGHASAPGAAASSLSPEAERDACLRERVLPALEAVRAQFDEEGYETALERDEDRVELRVLNFNGLPLIYAVQGQVYKRLSVNLASMRREDATERYARMEIESGGRRRAYAPGRCSRAGIERDALRYYRRFLMRSPPGWHG